MSLDLRANLKDFALLPTPPGVIRCEPLEDIAALRLEDVKRVSVLGGNTRGLDLADDVLADLTDVVDGGRVDVSRSGHGANLLFGDDRHGVPAPVIHAATRTGAFVALGVETTRVALVVRRVRALDHLHPERLVPLRTARAVVAARQREHAAIGLYVAQALGARDRGREQDELATRLTAAQPGRVGLDSLVVDAALGGELIGRLHHGVV